MNENLIFELLNSFSILIASSVAIFGITSWRRETKWKRKYEIAEEVLTLFYEVKERIEIIRCPLSNSDEGKTRKRKNNETEEQTELLDRAYVVLERYETEKTPFIKLKSMKYRVMYVFNKEAGEIIDEIFKLKDKITFAAYQLGIKYWLEQGNKEFPEDKFQIHLNKMNEFESIIWSLFDKRDLINKELETIINNAEEIFKP